jgi:glutathione S-transferase
LLGEFSIVDVFYAPVIFRLKTYAPYSGIALSESTLAYMATVLKHDSVKLWQEQAMAETDVVMEDEAGDEITDLGND